MKASNRAKKQSKGQSQASAAVRKELTNNDLEAESAYAIQMLETEPASETSVEVATLDVPVQLDPAGPVADLQTAEYRASVLAASQGSLEAFEQLYNQHADQIFRYVYYRVSNQSEAEDLVGQTFLQAWSSIGNYRPNGSPFVAWLYTIAHNLVVNYYKKSERQAKFQMPLGDWVADVQGPHDPYRELEQKVRHAALRQAILKLGPEQQKVIYFRYVEDLSHQQIAGLLGKTEAAVRVVQFRAQKALRQLLEQDGWAED